MNLYSRARHALVALALLAALAATRAAAADKTTARGLIARPEVLVIAHRGDSKAAPENTLPAFASAVKVGCDLVELDYYHSAEGVPVVLHDATLDRTTNAAVLWGGEKIPVIEKTTQQLAQLDAGLWFAPKFRGTKLPTLAESLDLIQQGSVTLIERKQGDAETCVRLLREKNLIDEVVVQAFDWKFLTACHELEPRLVLGALGGYEGEKLDEALLDATGAQAVGWFKDEVDQAFVERIHSSGRKLWAWTVDDMQQAEDLADLGVDGIISNVPAKVKAVLKSRVAAAK